MTVRIRWLLHQGNARHAGTILVQGPDRPSFGAQQHGLVLDQHSFGHALPLREPRAQDRPDVAFEGFELIAAAR